MYKETAITQECCEQYWTTPGGNTPQSTKKKYTATCLPSRKLSKLDEPDMQDTAGQPGTSSLVIYYGPPYMAKQNRTTSSNIHTVAMWGKGM